VKPFTPREPRTDEELILEARQRRFIKDLLADFLQTEDDVLSLIALRDIAWIMKEAFAEAAES
jgi:hypothetical protein